jgi:hypothetical protein
MKGRVLLACCFALGCLAAADSLDFRFFAERVQPIFVKQRTGSGRCYDCHSLESNKALFHLVPLDRGDGWSTEASRRNFDNAVKLVTPGEPLKSRLLKHPLAEEAGGDPFHTGGKFWTSRDDPEFRTLADWVEGATAK